MKRETISPKVTTINIKSAVIAPFPKATYIAQKIKPAQPKIQIGRTNTTRHPEFDSESMEG